MVLGAHITERRYKLEELSIPCFRCGVCCTRYQVRLSLIEARQIANVLGLAWDEWLDSYIDQSWPGIESLLLRRCKGACVFLEQIKDGNMTRCIIQSFKPSSCREWMPSLYQRECQQGLAQCWELTVNSLGQVEGSRQKLLDFYSFIESVGISNDLGH
jgi:Fe-S-cluster containining protein